VCALVCTIFQHMVLTFASKHSIAFRWLLDIIFISCSVSPQHLISAKVFLLFFSTRTVVYVIPWMHFVYLYYRNERISWEMRREKRKSEASKHAKQVLFLDLEDLHYFRQTHTPQKAIIAYLPFIPPTKWRESILIPNIWINLPPKKKKKKKKRESNTRKPTAQTILFDADDEISPNHPALDED